MELLPRYAGPAANVAIRSLFVAIRLFYLRDRMVVAPKDRQQH